MSTYVDTIAASADDAHEAQDGTLYSEVASIVRCDGATTSNIRFTGGFRFTGPPFANGDTINTAVIEVFPNSTANDDPNVVIKCDDQIDSPTFGSTDTPHDRTKTTAGTSWVATAVGSAALDSPDFTAAVQEVTDIGSGPGDAITVLFVGNSDVLGKLRVHSEDSGTHNPELTVTYTAAAGATLSERSFPRGERRGVLRGAV